MAKASLNRRAPATVVALGDLIVATVRGPYNVGEHLTQAKHIAEYLRMEMNAPYLPEGAADDSEPVTPEPTKLTDEQFIAAFKAVGTGDNLSPEDRVVAILDYAQGIGSTADEPLLDISIVQRSHGSVGANAIKSAQMFDHEAVAAVQAGIDGKITYDASPLVIGLSHIMRIYGKNDPDTGVPFLKAWPRMGTRKQDKTSKGKSTNNVPDNFQGPTQYYKTTDSVTGEPIYGDWLREFVYMLPAIQPLTSRLGIVRMLAKGEKPADLDSKNADGTYKYEDLRNAAGDDVAIKGVKADLESYITGFVNRTGRAIGFIQRRSEIEEQFSEVKVGDGKQGVRVRLIDDPDETNAAQVNTSARRNKPVQLCTVFTNAKGEKEIKGAPAITLTKFLNLNLIKAKATQGAPVAALLHSTDRGTKQKGTGATAEQGTPKLPLPTTAISTADYAAQMVMYFDKQEDSKAAILRAVIDPDKGGYIAYTLKSLVDTLKPIVDDANVMSIADAYNKAQLAGRGAAAQGEAAEAAAKLKQAANKAA